MMTFASLSKCANICTHTLGTQELLALQQSSRSLLKPLRHWRLRTLAVSPIYYNWSFYSWGNQSLERGWDFPRTHRKLPFKGAIYLQTKLWSQKEPVLILGVSLPSCDFVEPNSNRRAHTGGSRGEDICKALTTCLASW